MDPRKGRKHEALEAGGEVVVVPQPELLVLSIPGPSVYRLLEHLGVDVLKARFDHDVFQKPDVLEWAAEGDCSLTPQANKLQERRVLPKRAVIGLWPKINFVQFEVAIWVEIAAPKSGRCRAWKLLRIELTQSTS